MDSCIFLILFSLFKTLIVVILANDQWLVIHGRIYLHYFILSIVATVRSYVDTRRRVTMFKLDSILLVNRRLHHILFNYWSVNLTSVHAIHVQCRNQ